MKAYKTVFFILCVFGGLTILSSFFPTEGIQVGGALLEFPSLNAVLAIKDEPLEEDLLVEEPTLTPEQLIEKRMEQLRAARDSEFLSFCQLSPTRFFFPNEDSTFLDPVFEALQNAKSKPVRIMHYGDSQLEGDRITGVLRQELQETFGGCGMGLLPAVQTIGSATSRVETSPLLPHYMYFGSPDFRAEHKRYGPLAQVAEVDGEAVFTITAIGGSTYSHAAVFRRVVVALMGSATCTVSTGETEQEMTCSTDETVETLRLFSANLPRSTSKAIVRVNGNAEVFGISAEGSSGVVMDNIAMRGASGTLFTSIDSRTLRPFFQQQNVCLILLQYGGNSVPYLKGGKSISEYKQNLERQIALFKRMAPKSRIIFVGPADMAANEDGVMKTYPYLPMVVDSLRQAALDSGAAFWDMYRAMGGRGSMTKWVNANPPLAGEDYIHFTPRGARKISEMFYAAFDLYYKYYRFRHGQDPVELPDSVTL